MSLMPLTASHQLVNDAHALRDFFADPAHWIQGTLFYWRDDPRATRITDGPLRLQAACLVGGMHVVAIGAENIGGRLYTPKEAQRIEQLGQLVARVLCLDAQNAGNEIVLWNDFQCRDHAEITALMTQVVRLAEQEHDARVRCVGTRCHQGQSANLYQQQDPPGSDAARQPQASGLDQGGAAGRALGVDSLYAAFAAGLDLGDVDVYAAGEREDTRASHDEARHRQAEPCLA